jgi:tight adherence protein B
MRTALVVVISLAILGLLEAGYHATHFFLDRRGKELRRRLDTGSRTTALGSNLLRQGRFSAIPAFDAWLSAQSWARRLEHLLEQADSRMTVAQLVGFSALGASCGLILSYWLGIAPGLVVAAFGAFLPFAILYRARERRSRAISEQLPEALEMMARSLRAGHALNSAFQLAATEMPEPICIEFARAFEEQRLGMALERAVREMTARAPTNGDLKVFAVSTVIQKETGGNLAEIMDGIAATVRDRYRFQGKLRSLTAEARITAWFVSLAPLAMAAFFVSSSPAYMMRLVDNPLGRTMLAVGVGAWVLGVIWFQRLTKFDF